MAQNGGILGGLDFTTGKVDDGQTVVCLVRQDQKSCDRNNMLFTLNQENTKNPSDALVKITNFVQGKASNSPIGERGPLPQFISLETLVNRSLPQGKGF